MWQLSPFVAAVAVVGSACCQQKTSLFLLFRAAVFHWFLFYFIFSCFFFVGFFSFLLLYLVFWQLSFKRLPWKLSLSLFLHYLVYLLLFEFLFALIFPLLICYYLSRNSFIHGKFINILLRFNVLTRFLETCLGFNAEKVNNFSHRSQQKRKTTMHYIY